MYWPWEVLKMSHAPKSARCVSCQSTRGQVARTILPRPFSRTPVLRNPRADWPCAPNRRPRRGQWEASAKPCPPVPPRSVHVFRHDTPVAFIGSCSLDGVVLDEAAQPSRSPVIDFFSFSHVFIFGGRFLIKQVSEQEI